MIANGQLSYIHPDLLGTLVGNRGRWLTIQVLGGGWALAALRENGSGRAFAPWQVA